MSDLGAIRLGQSGSMEGRSLTFITAQASQVANSKLSPSEYTACEVVIFHEKAKKIEGIVVGRGEGLCNAASSKDWRALNQQPLGFQLVTTVYPSHSIQ